MIITYITHNILNILILSIIESITETLPISSTSHLLLISHLMNITNNQIIFFEAFIQLGSIFSLFILFKKKWIKIFFLIFFTIKHLTVLT